MNDLFADRSKVIGITSIKMITEKDLSVYNEEGIKAASSFDTKNAYTYELAIPLKYLNLPNDGADAFSYHVKVNEIPVAHVAGGPPPPPVMMNALGTTDFWGEYKLVKK